MTVFRESCVFRLKNLNLNTDELLQDLQCTPWDVAFVFDDINDVLSSIETMLNDVLDQHIPLKSKRVKRLNQPIWMTKEILHSMKTRDKLLKKARISNLQEDWTRYAHAKGQTTNIIRKTKRSFFREKIDENKGNPKGVWKALKSLSGTNKPQVCINEIATQNGIINDEADIANELNEYFVNILEQIGNNNDTGVDFDHTKLANFVHSRLNTDTVYNIPLLTPEQTIDIMDKISSNKASGYDGLSVRVLKKIIPVFANPLCKLLNLSISTNSFPNHWKMAKVTPLYKGGARNDINNYRPISVLPVLSKILEKHVASSLSKFLRDNSLLYELQSAFRPGHSTETALIRLTDQILMNMDNDNVTGLVLIDFRKAFDVIDHELLLKKLSIYGATPSSVAWFKSYLPERKQFISLGKTTSEQLTVKQGVPQGSILGPLLFLLFVNDMPLHVQKSTMDVYADDTTLSSSSNWKTIQSLNQALSLDLCKVERWASENKMYMNMQKTKALLVTGKRLRKRIVQDSGKLEVKTDNAEIVNVENHKLLGMIIDEDLTYEAHVDELCNKLSKRLGLLRHISPYLKKNQRIIYFNTIIKPLMMYASQVWTLCNREALERVLRMQKRAARIILEAQRTSRTVTLFNNLSWIPFYNEAYIKRCELAYKRINGTLPNYLNTSLRKNSDVHQRTTRNCNLNLLCPLHKNISEGGRTFAVRTVKDWNNLPRSLKTSKSLKSFKAELWKRVLNSQKTRGSFDINL